MLFERTSALSFRRKNFPFCIGGSHHRLTLHLIVTTIRYTKAYMVTHHPLSKLQSSVRAPLLSLTRSKMASTLFKGVFSPNKTDVAKQLSLNRTAGLRPAFWVFKAWDTAEYQVIGESEDSPRRYSAVPFGYPSAGCSPAEPASVSPNLCGQ